MEAKESPSTLSSNEEVIHYALDPRAILTTKDEEATNDKGASHQLVGTPLEKPLPQWVRQLYDQNVPMSIEQHAD